MIRSRRWRPSVTTGLGPAPYSTAQFTGGEGRMASSLHSDQGSPQSAQTSPASRRWSLPEYELAVSGLALLAAMALAWLYVVGQAPGMGSRAGTMGLGAWAFAGMWAVMVVAMMFPTVAPTGFRLAGRNAPGTGRPTRSEEH